MAALGVHQHSIDDEWIALPFPPRPLRPAGNIERVAPLEHDAFDRIGIGARAGRRRIIAGGGEIVPACEADKGGKINAGFA